MHYSHHWGTWKTLEVCILKWRFVMPWKKNLFKNMRWHTVIIQGHRLLTNLWPGWGANWLLKFPELTTQIGCNSPLILFRSLFCISSNSFEWYAPWQYPLYAVSMHVIQKLIPPSWWHSAHIKEARRAAFFVLLLLKMLYLMMPNSLYNAKIWWKSCFWRHWRWKV